MTLNFDSQHLPQSLPDWDRLVTACGQPDDTIETHYLERKGPLDLTTALHRFATARAILAFANRDLDAAAPFFDGHALLLIGIAKDGQIIGIPRIEDHELLKALKPYLGAEDKSPRWQPRRHRVSDTHDVLIIDVDTPRPGDPIYTLRKPFGERGGADAGAVFTRPSTESEPASSEAIEMLSRRLVARTKEFSVSVALNEDAITRYTYETAFLDPILRREVDRYWRAANPPPPPDPAKELAGGLTKPFAGLASAQIKALSGLGKLGGPSGDFDPQHPLEQRHEETRTKEEFRAELEAWTEKVRQAFPDFAHDVLAYRQPAALFEVTNTCGRFLEDLEVEVHIAGDVIQHPKPSDVTDVFTQLPRHPRKWGPWFTQRPGLTNWIPASNFPSVPRFPRPNSTDFHNSGSVTATLTLAELRPGRSHTFTDVDNHDDIVLLTRDLDMNSATVTVRATARGIDDEYRTAFAQPVTTTLDLTDHLKNLLQELYRKTAENETKRR